MGVEELKPRLHIQEPCPRSYEDFPQGLPLKTLKVVGRNYLTARCQRKIDLGNSLDSNA